MKSARLFACLVGVAAVTAIGTEGCSSGKSTPTSNDYDDVAQSTAALTVTAAGGGEIGSMATSASLALGVTPGDVTLNAAGAFGTVTAGVDYTFTVSCTDSSGAALAHCGTTTNNAHADVTWSGDLTLPGFSANVARQGDWTLSGVQTPTVTFDGTGSFTFASQFASAFRNEQASVNLAYSASYDGVTFAPASHHATGGTIHYTVDATRAASSTSGSSNAAFSVDALVTFNPDGSANLTLDGSHSYSISANGVVIKI